MMETDATDWLRILFLFLHFAAFLPQLRLLWRRRDSEGLSLVYVVLNLVVATELLLMYLGVLLRDEYVAEKPISFSSWLTVAHHAVVCFFWLLIFITTVVLKIRMGARRIPAVACAIYAFHLFVTLLPLIITLSGDTTPHNPYHPDLYDMIFVFLHMEFLIPSLPILTIIALYAQARILFARPRGSGAGALSLVSLAAQAVVSLLVSMVWLWILFWPSPSSGGPPSPTWYLDSYALFDYFVFAVAQAVLLVETGRRNGGFRRVVEEEGTGEREPLIPRTVSPAGDDPASA